MPSKNDAWGIEVGANAIKAINLVRDGDEVKVADFEVVPFKKILTTPDLDVDEAVQVGLDQLMNTHDFRKSTVVASVPGHMAFARFAKLPPVEPKKIAEIVRFEAVQQIPFPLEQVEWDYQVFQQDDSPEVEVGIFAITKDRVFKFLSDYQAVGLRVDSLTLSPLGVYNGLSYDLNLDESSPGTVFVDIGTSSTDVVIVESGGIWLRTLPIGGSNFSEALVKAFKLTFPKAEKLKREAGTSKYARQIFQAMRPVFADLVQEIQRSLGYYQSLNRDAELEQLIGVGSTFRLPGLAKFLKQQLQMDVKRLDGFQRAAADGKREADLAANALNLTTAYGLALQGLGLGSVEANILPAQILSERMWKAKQPMFAAAAAVVAAAVGASFFMVSNQVSAYDDAAQSNRARIDGAVRVASGHTDKLSDVMDADSDPRGRTNNLHRVLDYRDLWPYMISDLSTALEQVGAQPELVTDGPDYDAIASAIPRNKQKRILIKSYKTEYWPTGQDPKEAKDQSNVRRRSSDDEYVEDGGETIVQPKYLVRLEGVSPMAEGDARQLIQTFRQALAASTEGVNRPYRIVPDSVEFKRLRKIGEREATIKEEEDQTRLRTPVLPGGGGFYPGFDEFGGGYPGGFPGGGGGGLRGNRSGALASFMPEMPDAFGLHKDDQSFVVEWQVEILPPEDARVREDPNYVPPQPKNEDGDDADSDGLADEDEFADRRSTDTQSENQL